MSAQRIDPSHPNTPWQDLKGNDRAIAFYRPCVYQVARAAKLQEPDLKDSRNMQLSLIRREQELFDAMKAAYTKAKRHFDTLYQAKKKALATQLGVPPKIWKAAGWGERNEDPEAIREALIELKATHEPPSPSYQEVEKNKGSLPVWYLLLIEDVSREWAKSEQKNPPVAPRSNGPVHKPKTLLRRSR